MTKKGISRREFLKGAAIGVTAAGLAGCGPKDLSEATEAPEEVISSGEACDDLSKFIAESTAVQDEITEFTDGGEYDVIVVGAGAAGVPCAIKSFQEGNKVLVLQKEPTALSQGNGCTGIMDEGSDPQAKMRFVHAITEELEFRNDREQLKVYAFNSGEAVKWYTEELTATGYDNFRAYESSVDYGEVFGKLATTVCSPNKPDNTGTAMRAILEAYEDKIDVHYSTPAVQLIKDGNKVVGIFAKDPDGKYMKFSATKAVVIATGDYQNNKTMVERLCPDVRNFENKQWNRTGDGQLMGMMAGAVLEPVGHTKILHDFDSGPMWNEPFLCLNMDGERFFNEETDMAYIANYMRDYSPEKAGWYFPIFDDTFEEMVSGWGGRPANHDSIKNYMPEEDVEERGTVLVDRIAVYKADTLDELAEKLELPADELKASVARYNEIVDKGWDEDFGKDPKFLKKIETAPFWGVRKQVRVTAIAAGIITDATTAVLDENKEPIGNLYAIGNVSGPFYGSADYPMVFGGLSLGRCVTQGYVLGKMLGK